MKLLYTFILITILSGCMSIGGEAESVTGISSIDLKEAQSDSDLIITYTASINLKSKNIMKTLDSVKVNFSNYEGYVISESISDNYIYITYKIRTEEIKDFINILASNYDLQSSNIYSTDITNEYYDTQIRLENNIKTRERFMQLLNDASSVTEIIEIEKELSRVNEQIDLLEGQMKRLITLKDYSEVTIRINEKVTPGPLGWIFYGFYKAISWLFVW